MLQLLENAINLAGADDDRPQLLHDFETNSCLGLALCSIPYEGTGRRTEALRACINAAYESLGNTEVANKVQYRFHGTVAPTHSKREQFLAECRKPELLENLHRSLLVGHHDSYMGLSVEITKASPTQFVCFASFSKWHIADAEYAVFSIYAN